MSLEAVSTSSETSKPVLHAVHCDPCHDVALISNDNVEFRASSFQLSKISGFFADAFSIPAQQTTFREPIYLDFKSETISHFLDLIAIPSGFWKEYLKVSSTFTPHTLGALLSLVEFALCEDSITKQIRDGLCHSGRNLPLDLLVIASDRDDLELAKIAIAHMDTAIRARHLLRSFKSIYPKLRPDYQVELTARLFQNCYEWHDISIEFDPKLSNQSKHAEEDPSNRSNSVVNSRAFTKPIEREELLDETPKKFKACRRPLSAKRSRS